MAKVNCLMCGCMTEQLFCISCSEKGWERYRTIKQFLEKYPQATIIEVCNEMSVSVGFIRGLVKEGYLNMNLPR